MQAAKTFFIILVAAGCSFHAHATKNPIDYAKYLTDNKASAIAADILLGKSTPLFTGYGALNDAVPSSLLVNCHYGATYLGPKDKSASAAKYLADIEYVASDGYQPVVVQQPKGSYNQVRCK